MEPIQLVNGPGAGGRFIFSPECRGYDGCDPQSGRILQSSGRPHFEKEHGTLEQVLSVREADLEKNSTGRISWMKMPQKPHWKR